MRQKLLGNLKQGLLFVLSAPAGTGKTTLARMVQEEFQAVSLSISCTTRSPRGEEKEGKDYYFISKETFDEHVQNKDFLEHAEVFSHFYGTLKKEVETRLVRGQHVLLVIDTQGAMQVKEKSNAICIFICPPSLHELKKRLVDRNTEQEDEITERFSWAKQEMEMIKFYDYCIINDDLQVAYQVLRSILIAEEHRRMI